MAHYAQTSKELHFEHFLLQGVHISVISSKKYPCPQLRKQGS